MILGTNVNQHRGPRVTASPNSGDRSEPTYEELYEEAKQRGITGRSKMSKTELQRSLGR
jgi:hypothetical protein